MGTTETTGVRAEEGRGKGIQKENRSSKVLKAEKCMSHLEENRIHGKTRVYLQGSRHGFIGNRPRMISQGETMRSYMYLTLFLERWEKAYVH